jgi:GNAT superfamily N-acetyltransferase
MESDPNNELIVAELDGEIVGTLQLLITPSLSYKGGKRSRVESVRVESNLRGQNIGREMMFWAIERAKEKGCISMELSSHNERKDAHRFYEKLGFSNGHIGMKMSLK